MFFLVMLILETVLQEFQNYKCTWMYGANTVQYLLLFVFSNQ